MSAAFGIVVAVVVSLCFRPTALAEPLAAHQLNCTSGQYCVVAGLSGSGLADGDRMVLIPSTKQCGVHMTKIPGMPGALGETLPATSSGMTMRWSQPISADGGAYRMCWCSVAFSCHNLQAFSWAAGTMMVTGPIAGMALTCTSGHFCVITGMAGTNLRVDDSVMVLSACGSGVAVEGFPNGAKTSSGAMGGSEHGWGQERIGALGGAYRICWCAKGYTCFEGVHHRFDAGALTVVGPSGGLHRVCQVFEACTWSGVSGQGLQDADRMMPLLECGVGSPVVGFPNGGIAVAGGGGTSYAFAATDNVVTAGGADYALCWCQAVGGNVCSGPANFLTRAGTLTVQGPAVDHDISCIQAGDCFISNFRGVGLVDGDRVRILLQCGQSGLPGSTSTATAGGRSYTTWSAPVTAESGTFRICWCKSTWDCSLVSSFKMDVGTLFVSRINSGQHRSCHVKDGCEVSGLTGVGLRAGDLMMVLVACGGNESARVPGWPNRGLSNNASSSGTVFSWGVANRVESLPGTYKMCWCPKGHFSRCDEPSDFQVEAGDMVLKGPELMGKNATCTANQPCVVGPFDRGVGLSYGSDRVALVSSEQACGTGSLDPAVGGATGALVGGSGMISWSGDALPYGGLWFMCYCARHDSRLDGDLDECSSKEDFPIAAGVLTIGGILPNQGVNCTRGQRCEVTLTGIDVNKDTNRMALRDRTQSCGSGAAILKSLAGNPFVAASSSGGRISFTISPIQTLDTFYICYCVPFGALCGTTLLQDYKQPAGYLDIRGATPDQTFTCGRGGHCTLLIAGRHLQATDLVKVVGATENCSAAHVGSGFFRSLLMAEPRKTTPDLATFELGRVTAAGTYLICYCASLGGCDEGSEFSHTAGALTILEPLTRISYASSTAATLTVAVEARMASDTSVIRCAIAEFEPRYLPTAADIAVGLGIFGLGKGESRRPTISGSNEVEIFLNVFVRAAQQYRVWCVETSALSSVLPGHSGGVPVETGGGIVPPRLRTFPSFLWATASFYAQIYDVYGKSVVRTPSASTVVRVSTAHEVLCGRMTYAEALAMSVVEAGALDDNTVVLVSSSVLRASRSRHAACFFAGPNATGIAMMHDKMTVQEWPPTFMTKRLDGQTTLKFYRGALTQVVLANAAPTAGLLHWTTSASFDAEGCRGVRRSPPDAQVVVGGNTTYFRIDSAVGRYQLCYLGNRDESSTVAPFSGIGSFELVDAISSIMQEPMLPSTRSTVRLQLEVRVPGTVTCIAKAGPGVDIGSFQPGAAVEGRASLLVGPPPIGVDPEFPRRFSLAVPLVRYQRTAGPMRVWCQHSEADRLVTPGDTEGVQIRLQLEEPKVVTHPSFLWTGARFKLTFRDTPAIDSKRAAMHRPALPQGWSQAYIANEATGAMELRYAAGAEVVAEHPTLTAYKTSGGASPCEGSDFTSAVRVAEADFTQTESWLVANATSPFACYWASADGYPHLAGVLDISAQAPEFLFEMDGQVRNHLYRGVGVSIRLKYASLSGGRLLIVRRSDFDSFGGTCQEETDPNARRRLDAREWSPADELGGATVLAPEAETPTLPPPAARAPLRAQAAHRRAQTSQCTDSPRLTKNLRLLPAASVFPAAIWGVAAEAGANCTRDFKLYYSPNLVNTSILADVARGRYLLATSNATVLLHLFQKVRLLTEDGNLPNTSSVVVYKDFSDLGNFTDDLWVHSTQDCSAQLLLQMGSPMFEEGSESLPASQYLEAALDLSGFAFAAVVYFPPERAVVMQKSSVCRVVQPPPVPPPRAETMFDINLPGYGLPVEEGAVFVPSLVAGAGTFLHTAALDTYMLCYLGSGGEVPRIFNPIGKSFESRDVLSSIQAASTASDSLRAFLNITSELRGQVRCVAFLRNKFPPSTPEHIFQPDTSLPDYLGASELVQIDVAGTRAVIQLDLDQARARLITPAAGFTGAPPTMYIWCAHRESSIIYPRDANGFKLGVVARPPPEFVYQRFNQTVTTVELTLQLEFTPVEVFFVGDPNFPVNAYDEVLFSTRPALPKGLAIDPRTGAISGAPVPQQKGSFARTVTVASKHPVLASRTYDITIDVEDVLGMVFRYASAETVLVTVAPRATDVFQPKQIFILMQSRVMAFANTPEEFFCTEALADVPYRNESFLKCAATGGACCCASYVNPYMRRQDLRIPVTTCQFERAKNYHARGLVGGELHTGQGTWQPARLRSQFVLEAEVPDVKPPEEKKPVTFNIVVKMGWGEYSSQRASYDEQLRNELSLAVDIPVSLVKVLNSKRVDLPARRLQEAAAGADAQEAAAGADAQPADDEEAQPVPDGTPIGGGTPTQEAVEFEVRFEIEARCLEQLSNEVKMFAGGIQTQEGCNEISPEGYMLELKAQLADPNSALFYRQDLDLVRRASADFSFSSFRVMHFCDKEPVWEFGAVAVTEDECPFDTIKLAALTVICSTICLMGLLAGLAQIAHEFARCHLLARMRTLDVLSPMLSLYTTAGDYLWLFMLRANASHPMHDTFFLAAVCHLFLCFCINALSVRLTITTYIWDTPWWRRNRRRLRLTLFVSCLNPRFFRITRANLFGLDQTHIHFGTPSKMSVVFSNLGLVVLFQDIPELLLQGYVWMIWRSQAPKLSLFCLVLGGQSVATALLHHIFSRSQRAAYERVVKLLGVRRLTAGFFDVSAGVGQPLGLDNIRRADGGTAPALTHGGDGGAKNEMQGELMDPSKLDPIQAAMYVSKMYERENRGALRDAASESSEGSEDSEGSSRSGSKDPAKVAAGVAAALRAESKLGGRRLYPAGLYERMRRFYEQHDPARLDTIGLGDVEVDEAQVDAELKASFGVGLDSVE